MAFAKYVYLKVFFYMYKNNNVYLLYLFFISLVAGKHAILVSGHGMDILFIDYNTGVNPDGQNQSKNPQKTMIAFFGSFQ